jgi:hypothetical protein
VDDYELDIAIAKMKRGDEIANFGNEYYDPLSPDWNPVIELLDSRPPQFEWVCIGEYNGVDIPDIQIGGFYTDFDDVGSLMIIESDYKVWQLLPNPEYNCKVTIP